jgi:hypothetical protein
MRLPAVPQAVIELEDIQENLDAEVFCLHCDGQFQARSLRLASPLGNLQCANADCDGESIDLSFDPWWRDASPHTYHKATR